MFILLLKLFIVNTLTTKNIFILNNTVEDHIINIRNVNNNNLTETENKVGNCDIPHDIDEVKEMININRNFYNQKLLKTLENPNVSDYDKVLLIKKYDILQDESYAPNILKGLDMEGFI
tara:strand:+ start:739 stop:1095 length:357 start_codon:yes stop_codon:yes gene_type:complete